MWVTKSGTPGNGNCGGRRLFRKLAIRAAITISILVALAIGGFWAAVWWLPFPNDQSRPSCCTWIEDRTGAPLAAYVGPSDQWQLPLTDAQISPHLLDAILATEDARFFQHGGVDWHAAAGALFDDVKSLGLHRGASTITMQLYRLEHPAPRSMWNKLEQAVRACQLQRQFSKRDILIDYVNRAPFGGNLVGAGAASWRYFGRPCINLSLGQAALLAGLPQNPNHFRPDRFPQRAIARRDHVLDRMLACGMISQAQRDQAANEPLDAGWRPLPQDADANIGLTPTLAELARNYPGQKIHTHIDLAVQKQAAFAAKQSLDDLAASHISAAAVVVLDTQSGQCLAAVSLVTGDGAPRDVDLTSRPRSSGSTLKPFIYAAAFDAGICTPQTMLDDSPAAWSGYEPRDYDRDFRGWLPAWDALAQSRNVPALRLLSKLGTGRAVEVMNALGLTTLAKKPDRYGLPLAIGGAEVTPLELAGAYATLARGGFHRPASLFDDNINAAPLTHGSALRPQICLATLNCLADPSRTAGINESAAQLGPAWKTGTSSGHRDAWCAAVTPRRTIVVWLGNADGLGSDTLVGADAAAPLALKILTLIDPGGPGFAPPWGFAVAHAQPATPIDQEDLTLLSPTAGQVIIHDPAIPADEQRLALRACNGATSSLWWFVDGTCLGQSDDGQPLWWSPIAGNHDIRAVDAAGHFAHARIQVK